MDTRTIRARLEGRHPSLGPDLARTRRHVYAASHRFDTAVDAFWPLISDSSSLNRALGIPRASFVERDGVRHGESRYWRTAFRWSEPPWEWTQGEILICRKSFSSGPMRSVLAVLAVEPTPSGGSELLLWYGWEAKGFIGRLVAPRLNAYIQRGYGRLVPRIRAWEQADDPPQSFPLSRPRETNPAASSLALPLLRAGAPAAPTETWVQTLLCADALTLHRIRPFELAHAHAIEASALLDTALLSTRLGQVIARWDVTCPHCRGARQSLPDLGHVAPVARCEPCEAEFSVDAERLELTFRVHPSVRVIEPRVYCAADAALMPHVLVQVVDTDRLTLPAAIPPGRYLLRHVESGGRVDVMVGTQRQTDATFETPLHTHPGAQLHLPRTGRWTLSTLQPTAHCIRPADVVSHPLYREVMGNESLAADVALEVGEQTLLFTDVVGSTQLYQDLGDRGAFEAIRTHFVALFALVRAHDGVVIKTIGDAIMASFPSPEAGLQAAQAIARADLSPVAVRLSMHTGPCIAVNLDAGVDYFGAVVNEAAKLQGAAGPSELALVPSLAATLGLTGTEVPYLSGSEERTAVVWSAARPAPGP